VALALFEVSPITTPLFGASPISVIVPVAEVPPTTDVGDTDRLENVGALIVRLAFCTLVPIAAATVTVSLLATPFVVMAKVADVDPPGMRTVAGTWASVPVTDKVTVAPAGPGVCPMVTVPVLDVPPGTVVGLRERLATVYGLRVKFAVAVAPLYVAVIGTIWPELSGWVVIANVAEVLPAGIVTVAGTDTFVEDELNVNVVSAGWAGLTVIVPVEPVPPNTADGSRVRIIWKGTIGAATIALSVAQRTVELSDAKANAS
jgi:hypothetical protein